jgi:uncharacterized membrane protein
MKWDVGVPTGKFLDEKRIHLIFEVSLLIKGAFAGLEIIGSFLVYFVPKHFIVGLVAMLTQSELAEDPRDLVANYLLHAAHHLSVGTKHFAALYLLSHGAVKLWLIVGLLRERLWYYPVALIVFAAFIGYQLYRFSFTHSAFLILLTAVDIVVIILTWHEFRYLRRHRAERR